MYADTVAYAKFYGTAIVAAAGNEHAEIGTDGLVLTHGILTAPGGTLSDFFGWYEVPGGLPGVVDVSSTGNVVNASSASCADGTWDNTNATCKFTSDAHQSPGTGQRDQLAYYSNYGTRIDFAAPGGARKFNLPVWDRGGTGGFPVTGDDGTRAWEDFNITSDWATQITCYVFQQMPNDCFSTIQGTSMATPHVSAVLALVLAVHPESRATRRWGTTRRNRCRPPTRRRGTSRTSTPLTAPPAIATSAGTRSPTTRPTARACSGSRRSASHCIRPGAPAPGVARGGRETGPLGSMGRSQWSLRPLNVKLEIISAGTRDVAKKNSLASTESRPIRSTFDRAPRIDWVKRRFFTG